MIFPFGLYFGWPAGAVWSNLAASLICGLLVWWRVRARMIAQHLERRAQAQCQHLEMKDHVTAAALASRRPLMTEEEFDRNLAEMTPDLNCFTCGYSGRPRLHAAKHAAFLAAMQAQRDAPPVPGTADLDQMAAEYRRRGGEQM